MVKSFSATEPTFPPLIQGNACVGLRAPRFRVVTYNIHKSRGLDGRVLPGRIADVLREIDADVVALQEVTGRGGSLHQDHAHFVADELRYYAAHGENRRHRGAAYGNLLLSRYPLRHVYNYDISVRGREPRGVLRADIVLDGGRRLHVFNVHLGTGFMERRKQARYLVNGQILRFSSIATPSIILGDFNELTRGLVSRVLSAQFNSSSTRKRLGHIRTYPSVLPLFHLDHIYFNSVLTLRSLTLHRSRKALLASDHLPLVADFLFYPDRAEGDALAPTCEQAVSTPA